MADKIVQFTDKDGNDIYPVSKLPGNAVIAEDLVQLTTTDLENLTNLITPILLSKVYPIGSIFISVNSTNPGTYLGGTWVAWGTGRTLVGIDGSDTNFNTVEKTGGEKTHKLTQAETPAHTHTRGTMNINGYYSVFWSSVNNLNGAFYGTDPTKNASAQGGGKEHQYWDTVVFDASRNWTGETSSIGGGGAHNNLQPYITCYMWKRTK